jgi:THO complex subunit 2
LTPDDKVIHKEWEKDMKEAKEYVRKLSIISTKDKDKEEPAEEKEKIQEKVNESDCNIGESLVFPVLLFIIVMA